MAIFVWILIFNMFAVEEVTSLSSIIEPVCVVEGATVDLQCKDSSNSAPTESQQNITVEYTWQLDGVDIDPSSPPVNHRLESSGNEENNLLLIDNIQRGHSGSYTCRSEEAGSGLTSGTSPSVSLSVTYVAGQCEPSQPVYSLEQQQNFVVDISCTNENFPNGDGIWTVPYQYEPINTGASRRLTTSDNNMDGTYLFHVVNCAGVWGNTKFKVIVDDDSGNGMPAWWQILIIVSVFIIVVVVWAWNKCNCNRGDGVVCCYRSFVCCNNETSSRHSTDINAGDEQESSDRRSSPVTTDGPSGCGALCCGNRPRRNQVDTLYV